MKKYYYFISYDYFVKKGYGKGNCEIPLPKMINDIDDIKEIQNHLIEEKEFDSVIISNFIFLRDEQD